MDVAEYVTRHTDLKVAAVCGETKHSELMDVLADHQVIVITAVDAVKYLFCVTAQSATSFTFSMSMVNVLVIDNCHAILSESQHDGPLCHVMAVYKATPAENRPHILGLTGNIDIIVLMIENFNSGCLIQLD